MCFIYYRLAPVNSILVYIADYTTKIFQTRLHYSATGQKNKKFLLLIQQQLTVFRHPKNHRFFYQTRKFVQSIEGPCFWKELKMNTKLHNNNQAYTLTLFFLSFMNFMVKNKSRRSSCTTLRSLATKHELSQPVAA